MDRGRTTHSQAIRWPYIAKNVGDKVVDDNTLEYENVSERENASEE
jgi:hypothetical protein